MQQQDKVLGYTATELIKQINLNPSNFAIQPFTQTFLIASLAAGASLTVTTSIDASAAFVWQSTSYFSTIANAAQTDATRVLPLIRMQITAGGSSRQLFDQPIPISSIAGHDGEPKPLPTPFLVQNNSNLSGQFTNFDADATYVNTVVVCHGFRVYL